MEMVQKEINEIILVAVEGKMVAEQFFEFKNNSAIVKNGSTRLLVDLSALNYIESKDLRMLLKTIKKINQKNGKVVLCCLSGYVKEIFEVSRFQDTIAITNSVESGMKVLSEKMKAA